MKFEDIITPLITYENTTKKIIRLIEKTYGKKFIEDTLTNNQKKVRHTTTKIMNYYELQQSKYPEKQKKEIRVITALYFNISEKAVQYHITKSKS
ncbi:hypothetical protein [Aliarcobacter butzleri]|uniref:hypothetical protein n=1 Tax=Aliarcobacter butzleri TaxID=28197 RepID=UPI0021B27FDA|nr:hypothetical protein [Aliarcobacter butzleri]MCT7648806.1 hypothetical protein [Aliarcobacter butzleri]